MSSRSLSVLNTYADSVLFFMLTGLVPYRTGSLACGLTGRLAFSASAFVHCMVQCLRIECLNVLHLFSSYHHASRQRRTFPLPPKVLPWTDCGAFKPADTAAPQYYSTLPSDFKAFFCKMPCNLSPPRTNPPWKSPPRGRACSAPQGRSRSLPSRILP